MKTQMFTLLSLVVSIVLLPTLVPSGAQLITSAPITPTPPALSSLRGTSRSDIEGSLPTFDQSRMQAVLESTPVMFIENIGNADDDVRFYVRGSNGTLWLTEDALWFTVMEHPQSNMSRNHALAPLGRFTARNEDTPHKGVNLRLSFVDANPNPRLEPFNRLDTHVSYLIGNDPAKWQPNVPVWGGVRYVNLYPGIDLEVTSQEGRWNWRLASHSSPFVTRHSQLDNVRLRVEGADALTLSGDHLCFTTTAGYFTLPLLSVESATLDGQPETLNVAQGEFEISFPFSTCSISSSVILSPHDNPDDLLYSTFLGGSDNDAGYAIAVDGVGNAYVTGDTWSSDFPTTAGAFDTSYNGNQDAFVVKVHANGTGLAYATFLGGSSDSDFGHAIAVDGVGNAYVAGWAVSSDFPTTAGAFDTDHNGGYDVFVVKVNPTGTGLTYATFLGGSSHEGGYGITVDGEGSAYVTGDTWSSDFPTTAGAFDTSYNGNQDAFVAKVNAVGTGLEYATFLGGSSDSDFAKAIVVDEGGSTYVTGYTSSSDFVTTAGAFDTSHNGNKDTFVAKVSAAGTELAYVTFLGGSDSEEGSGITVDGDGSAYVTGWTESSNFPTTTGGFDTSYNGGAQDAFVAKVNAAGSGLSYATFLGGSSGDSGDAIAVDETGSAYVTGETHSANFPLTAEAFDTSHDGDSDAFVANLNASGSEMVYATFLGGSVWDRGWAIDVDGVGSIYVSGFTTSHDFPTTVGAFDTTHNGGYDPFVAKLVLGGGSSPPLASISFIWYPSYPNPAIQGQDMIYFNGSGTDQDEGGAYITAYVWSSNIDGQLSSQEDFTIEATELSAGTHTLTFKAQDNEGEWSPEATRTLTVQSAQADIRTLILVNRQKLETLYGRSEATEVMNKLNTLAAHDSVKGVVVQVDNDVTVAASYATWDADPTNTAKANAVTEAIKALINAQWASNPDLEYLIIVGDDRTVPFHRVLDQTRHPESNYRSISPTSTTGAALQDDMSLTDDYYADGVPTVPDSTGWDGHNLYIPDLGTGRLIETPSEIIAQIDAFLTSDGVPPSDAIVTGYDFMKDGAQAMCNELNSDGITTDCTLIGDSWGRADFIAKVLNIRHGIVSINGHANHYVIGTPSGSVLSSDVAGATSDHTRAIFYTVGCHSGLNVPPANPYQPLDTAQALIQHQANYIANTGYGWGYVTSIGLSEQLMLDFTEWLGYGQSATVGQALATAKQKYYLNDADFDYYDEKIMIESTLYGLPMYRYTTPTATAERLRTQVQNQGATVIKDERLAVLGDGLTINSISYQFPALTSESTEDGLYYTFGDLVHAGNGEPIQPKYTADLSFPETKAHGLVFRGGVYTDITSFNPVVDRAITETITLAEPAFNAPGWYPSLLHRLNRLERGDHLVTLLGQFNAQSQTERIYDHLSFDIYYHTSSSDWIAPSTTSISSSLSAGDALITVGAEDASGIEAIVVAHTDGYGTWSSTRLTENGGASSGSFPASAETEFFVQVVDKAGNVAVNDNNGRYFKPGDGLSVIYLSLILRNH